MSEPYSPPWKRGSATRRASSAHPNPNPNLRVSDAERAEVADRLSKHYSEGRLDQAEFNERLDQATRAKTQSDLSGLFADLPDIDAPGAARAPTVVARQRTRRPYHRILFLALVVLITAAAGQALVHFYVPWLLIGLLAFLWLCSGRSRHHRL
jgi:hypothetical protein